jgi:hypothetical protein
MPHSLTYLALKGHCDTKLLNSKPILDLLFCFVEFCFINSGGD